MTDATKESIKDQVWDWLKGMEIELRTAGYHNAKTETESGEKAKWHRVQSDEHADTARKIKNDIMDIINYLEK